MTKAANIRQTPSPAWHTTIGGALALSALCLALAYLMLSRAIFTGSLQQYFLTVVLVVLAANRAVVSVRATKGK